MAKKEELFWTGVGVKTVDGKDYGAGMPLPVDKIDPDDLKKMKKDGRIGTMIAIVSDVCKDCVGHLDTIEAKNILIEEIKGSGNTGELESQINEKELRIIELGSEVERLAGINSDLTTDTEEKAALIKEQKAEIKELKKAAKEAAK